MKKRHLVRSRRIILIAFFVASVLSVNAQVMWNLKGGIIQRSFYDSHTIWDKDDPGKRLDWMAGLEMEIPLSDRLNLETGVLYKNHKSLVKHDFEYDYYDDWLEADSHLELPLRLAYKQPLGEYFSLHIGVGPYASYTIGEELGNKWHNNLQVGLQPSIAINWACLSLGATYNIPCFYKGYKDENKPAVMLTLGIRFKSHVWKYVGATLLTIASVGAAAGYVWEAANSSSYSSSSYSSGSSYRSSSSSYSGSSSSSLGKSCKFCAGSGRCSGNHRCRGTGKCNYCNGEKVKSTDGHYHECGACHGTGKCSFCGGSGKCKHCGGTGRD